MSEWCGKTRHHPDHMWPLVNGVCEKCADGEAEDRRKRRERREKYGPLRTCHCGQGTVRDNGFTCATCNCSGQRRRRCTAPDAEPTAEVLAAVTDDAALDGQAVAITPAEKAVAQGTMPASGYGWRQFKERPRKPRQPALIEDTLWANVGGFFIALPKKFKSLTAVAMAVSLATGERFAGRFAVPTPRRVFYAMEDTDSDEMIEDRVDAFLRGHGLGPADGAVLDQLNERLVVKPWNGFKLDDPRWRSVLADEVCGCWGAEVAFLDVFRNMTGKNWNLSEEMGPLLDFLTGLHVRHGTTFILVHHEGYSAPGRPTGTVTLDGWWQQCISFQRVDDEPGVRLTIESKERPTAHRRLALYAETRTERLENGGAIDVPHLYRFSVADDDEEEKAQKPAPETTADKVLALLGSTDRGMLADDVADKIGVTRKTAKDALDLLFERGSVERCGEGRRNGARTGPTQPLYRRTP